MNLRCNPPGFDASSYASSTDEERLALSMFFCNQFAYEPRYPALYYLFPKFDHTHAGANGTTYKGQTIDHTQPAAEPYAADVYIRDTVNTGETYQAISDADLVTDMDAGGVTLRPDLDPSNWVLPNHVNGSIAIDDAHNQIVDTAGSRLGVGFLDRVFFNGRDMLTVRSLDIDLNMLRQIKPRGQNPGANGVGRYQFGQRTDDNWLTVLGIVYAFREDGMREDALLRPLATGNCASGAQCNDAENFTDPDIAASGNGISPKPVDFHPDPERRVHGFRLLNGSILKRVSPPGPATNVEDSNIFGITFVSDNPTYIQGDFNLHNDDGTTTRIEEFDELLAADFGNFYSRSTLNTDFARPTTDDWRPSEVLADSVSILSENFCEGSVADMLHGSAASTIQNGDGDIGYDRYNGGNADIPVRLSTPDGCTTLDGTSYLGGFLLQNDGAVDDEDRVVGDRRWLRANPAEISILHNLGHGDGIMEMQEEEQDAESPPLFHRNGDPTYFRIEDLTRHNADDPANPIVIQPRLFDLRRDYFPLANEDRRTLGINTAEPTRVNALIVGGVVPSRAGQSYGGLHNFPRFLEFWDNTLLSFAGSFLQLNFSTYSTGPFDQDAWEIDDTPDVGTGADNDYYFTPDRNWGYDVALLYAVPGPIAERFLTAVALRSEFYTEPPVNDPYMFNLCEALRTEGLIDKAQCPAPPMP